MRIATPDRNGCRRRHPCPNSSNCSRRRYVERLEHEALPIDTCSRRRSDRRTSSRWPLFLLSSFAPMTAVAVASSAHPERVYRPRRYHAPSRPSDAPPIDYGGVHPFDRYRHLYDDEWAARSTSSHGRRARHSHLHSLRSSTPIDETTQQHQKTSATQPPPLRNYVGDYDDMARPIPSPFPTRSPISTAWEGSSDPDYEDDKDGSDEEMEVGQPPQGPQPQVQQEQPQPQQSQQSQQLSQLQSSSSSSTSSTIHQTTTLAGPARDALYRPLRIQFETRALRSQLDLSLGAGDHVAATQLYLLIYEILPMTREAWGDLLRVIPVQGGIYPLEASAGVGGNGGYDGDGGGKGKGDGDGEGDSTSSSSSSSTSSNNNNNSNNSNRNNNNPDPVKLLYCPDETTAGISGGADLLIYATVNRHCGGAGTVDGANKAASPKRVKGMGTLASALSCQRDQYDRPITGSIDFCLGGMGDTVPMDVAKLIARKTDEERNQGKAVPTEIWDGWLGAGVRGESLSSTANVSEGVNDGEEEDGGFQNNREVVQYSAGVAIHEIGHVLGVTSDSLAYFRNPITGQPLTPRPFTLSTVTCVTGEEMAYIGVPGPNVMTTGVSEGTGQRFYEIVTPTVRRVVRNHFHCPTMNGARLENQPTSNDCFGSHFDERYFYTEIMGAVFSQTVNMLSPLTLALLEDSGWYRANYQSQYVQLSMFGHGAGCGFLESNCIDPQGQVSEAMSGNFCNSITHIGSNNMIDPLRSGPQTCDPSHTRKTYCDLVDVYDIEGTTSLDVAPARFQYFESQPSLRPYTFINADYCPIPHLDPQSCQEYNGRSLTNEQLEAGEYYGSDSRCVETDGSRKYSLCLQTSCNERTGLVQLVAGGKKRTCEYDGQIHTILFNYDGDGPLRIKCPKAAMICPQLFCPAACSGRGDCVYRDRDSVYGEPPAKCVCDDETDDTDGCFNTKLTFPAGYGGNTYGENPNGANKALFMGIVGSLVAGLAVMYIVIRQWKARQNIFM